MNKKNIIRIALATLCIGIGLFIANITADQQFFDLTPNEIPELVLPMQSGTSYEQTFFVRRKTLTRLGLYMRPLQKISDPTASVRISLLRKGASIASGEINAIFIENGGPSYVRFESPVITYAGEQLTIRIIVSDSISGVIALRQRIYEDSTLFAYNAFEAIRPPFLRQFGVLLITLGIALLALPSVRKYKQISIVIVLFIIALLHGIPALDASMEYSIFTVVVFALLLCMWDLLRIAGRSQLSAIFGACVFALSSWLPLTVITGRSITGTLNARDTLLDPNQIAVSHSAGAYIGVFGLVAALIGIAILIVMISKKQQKRCELETWVAMLLILSASIAFIPSPLANGHAAIGVAFALAWFASFGFWHIQRFIGMRDTLVNTILMAFVVITILDLMHVTARTFTYGLGI